jgi:DNA processing protein
MTDPRLAGETAEMLALLSLPGMTNRRLGDLLALFGSPAGAWEAVRAGAADGHPDRAPAMAHWGELARAFDQEARWHEVASSGIGMVVRGQAAYPPLLAETRDAPWALFFRGGMPGPGRVSIAVVGSRKATQYGLEVARFLGRELSLGGANVVSGAAYGIDSAAHLGALEAGGPTTAVMGCGVDVAYPRSSAATLQRIAETGCVLSEYLPGTHPTKASFPARNRIIAGMSRCVVVVEAAEGSGALLTADIALAEGRDVMAVPGEMFSNNSRGTNALIRGGAMMVTCPEDVLSEVGLCRGGQKQLDLFGLGSAAGGPDEHRILAALAGGTLDVEGLSRETGQPVAGTLAMLSRLEIAGFVSRGPGGTYHLSADAQAALSRSTRK